MQRFDRALAIAPKSDFLKDGRVSLSYAEAHEKSQHVAGELRHVGFVPPGPVALCLNPSADVVIAMLAAWAAGAHTVPIYPDAPAKRTAGILRIAEVKFALVHERYAADFPKPDTRLVAIDRLVPSLQPSLAEVQNSLASPDGTSLATIIFTSGSTGAPKGCMLSHANLAHVPGAEAGNNGKNVGVVTTFLYTWDAFLHAFSAAVSSTAFLYIPSSQNRTDPLCISQAVESSKASVLMTTAPFLDFILDHPERLATLRTVIVGGEIVPPRLVTRFCQTVQATLLNCYGLTETSVMNTWHLCSPADGASDRVPVGVPHCDAQRVYILREDMQRAALGENGQIAIGGPSVFMGYFKDEALTAERLVQDPFDPTGQGQLFLTGDIGRWSPDGALVFEGRMSRLTKVRGIRVDPSEVERHILAQPGVSRAFVHLRGGRLTAHLALADPSDADVRSHEEAHLSSFAEEIEDVVEGSKTASKEDIPAEEAGNLNIEGWIDSFSGETLPAQQMQQWVGETIDRIRSFHPRRIMEIGCGNGLLLFPLASHCSEYLGVDIQKRAVDFVNARLQALASQGRGHNHVRVEQNSAACVESLEPNRFDMIIINSVAMYFPSMRYFAQLLRGCASKLAPGGVVFVGDIRDHRLLREFCTAVQMGRCPPETSKSVLRQKVIAGVDAEEELLVDPDFFSVLAQATPELSHAEILLKESPYQNEMTLFRYDAVLHTSPKKGVPAKPADDIPSMAWRKDLLDSEEFLRYFKTGECQQSPLMVRAIPNSRLDHARQALQLIEGSGEHTAQSIRAKLGLLASKSQDPHSYVQLARDMGCAYILRPSLVQTGCFDVVFHPMASRPCVEWPAPQPPRGGPWSQYGSNPLQRQMRREVLPKLRRALKESLLEEQVPERYVFLQAFPLTENGKIDASALPSPNGQVEGEADIVPPRGYVEGRLAEAWKDILEVGEVSVTSSFFDVGGNSMSLARLFRKLNPEFPSLTVAQMFKWPRIRDLAQSLSCPSAAAHEAAPPSPPSPAELGSGPCAILGLACRLPGAEDVAAYWENLAGEVDSISRLSQAEAQPPDASWFEQPGYVRAWGEIKDLEQFDAAFFGIPPVEARLMDPQTRLFLEATWQAFEDAGHNPRRSDVPISIIAGKDFNTYLTDLVAPAFGPRRNFLESAATIDAMLGSAGFSLAAHVAHKLNLTGRAQTIDTGCSTSLVAISEGSRCAMAAAGGVTVRHCQTNGYLAEKSGLLSPTGYCRPFDWRSDGTVFGNGLGAAVLRRLGGESHGSGPPSHAVISGSATNNDGGARNNFASPSVDGQARVVAAALADARLTSDAVDLVEAHGTATAIGDPIEIAALTQAYRCSAGAREPHGVGVGSVKSNIGHMGCASGAAGLIKVVMGLKHQCMPASLHFEKPSPYIDFASTPFRVSSSGQQWVTQSCPRRAGVSSFGMGGTNVHVVLEEPTQHAPRKEPGSPTAQAQLVTVSAQSPAALRALVARHADHLSRPDAANKALADIAFTANAGRVHMPCRAAFVCSSAEDLVEQLRSEGQAAGVGGGRCEQSRREKLCFLFPGVQSLCPGMGRQLYQSEPAFRQALDQCLAAMPGPAGADIRELLLEGGGAEARVRGVLAELAILCFQLSLARLWSSWGLRPEVAVGDGVGEFAASVAVGAVGAEGEAALLAAWTELRALRGGGSEAILQALEGRRLASALAAPRDDVAVVSAAGGDAAAVWRWCQLLDSPLQGLAATDTLADGAAGDLAGALRGVGAVVELSGGGALAALARSSLPEADAAWVGPLGSEAAHRAQKLDALRQLYLRGFEVDWPAVHADGQCSRLHLPTYPFQRQRFWQAPHQAQSVWPPPAVGPASSHVNGFRRTVQVQSFEKELDLQSDPELGFLMSHQIEDKVIYPMTAYLDVALSVAGCVLAPDSLAIRDFFVKTPMDLSAPRTLRASVASAGAEGTSSIEIHSASGAQKQATHHGGASLLDLKLAQHEPVKPAQTTLDVEGWKARLPEAVEGEMLYQELRAIGANFGRDFRLVEHVWRSADKVLGCIRSPDGLDSFAFHPALLDACMHIAGVRNSTLYLPASVEFTRLFGRPQGPGPFWSLVDISEAPGSDSISLTVHIFDSNSKLLALLQSITCLKVRETSDKASNSLYVTSWQDCAWKDGSGTGAPAQGNLPLVVFTSQELPAVLAARAVVVSRGEEYKQSGEREFQLCLHDAEQFRRLFRDIRALVAASMQPWHLVYAWGLEEQEELHAGVAGALHLIQAAVSALPEQPEMRLWLATDSCQALSQDQAMRPEQALVWGLGKAARHEYPELRCTTVDLHLPHVGLEALLAEAAAPGVEGDELEIALRRGRRCVARLQKRALPAANGGGSGAEDCFEGVFAITGGLGALGRAAAGWLASGGATHVVLASRRPWSSAQGPAQADALPYGVRAEICDVSDAAQARALIERCARLGSLRGVLHAAGVRNDAVFANQTAERMLEAMGTKVGGTRNLDVSSAELAPELEHFVCYSSAASVLGSSGQSNYIVANAFMDAFAHHRRHLGLPALSINWGAFEDAGMFAELSPAMQRHYASMGVRTIRMQDGLDIMGKLMRQPLPQMMVCPVDWALYARALPKPAGQFLALLAPQVGAAVPQGAEAEAEAERKGVGRQALLALVADVLDVDPTELDFDATLEDAGLDSLGAIRLRRPLQEMLGSRMPGLALPQQSVRRLLELAAVPAPAVAVAPPVPHAAPAAATGGRPPRCLVPLRQGGHRIPIFLFCNVAGFAEQYQALAARLGDDQPLYALEPIGLGGNLHDMPDTIDDYVRHYLGAVQSVQPHGPYLLMGHSIGGLMARAVAALMRASDLEVQFLGLVDIAPFPYEAVPPATMGALLRLTPRALLGQRPEEIYSYGKKWNPLPVAEELADAQKKLAEMGISFSDEQLLLRTAALMRYFRAEDELHKSLRYEPLNMTFFFAAEPVCELPLRSQGDPAWGWRQFNSEVEVVELEGHHYNILSEPRVEVFAEHLRQRVSKANLTSFFFRARDVAELEARYDFWADSYDAQMDEVYGRRGDQHPFALAMQKHLQGGRVLDAGAGTGAVGDMLRGTGCQLIGIDISEGMLARARDKGTYAELRRMELGKALGFPTDFFDGVASLGTFEYGHAPADSFDELLRVTKEGGVVIFTMRRDLYSSGHGRFRQKMEDLRARSAWELVDQIPLLVQHSGEAGVAAVTEMDVWVFRAGRAS